MNISKSHADEFNRWFKLENPMLNETMIAKVEINISND